MREEVIPVDEADRSVGAEEKLRAHTLGLLHRAFSVFIFNRAGAMLLQRRAASKYHSPNRWSNACCGHPRPHETTPAAAERRLNEELGLSCALTWIGGFLYRAALGGALCEHEYDHVFVGTWEGRPRPDPREVGAWRWTDPRVLRRTMAAAPDRFTAWLPLALGRLDRWADERDAGGVVGRSNAAADRAAAIGARRLRP